MYTTLRDYRFGRDIDDIRGSSVYGADDEKIGKIDDVVFDSNSGQIRYLVVDTGGWLTSRRFLLPPDALRAKAIGGARE
jgi:sporulation protein YlmC with PRC-barrel domain